MRVISCNVNGIRAAESKGFFVWLKQQNAEVICVQETKAQTEQLSAKVFWPKGYYCFYSDAIKKGYSGVAMYCKTKPTQFNQILGWKDIDAEGRFISANFGKLNIISLYLPSGSSGEVRQRFKFSFLERFRSYMLKLESSNQDYIICGDWNIAHKTIDLKNWRGNKKNSGFLPEERAWMNELFAKQQWFDSFRLINKQAEQYTWWSNRGQSWAKNVGWRIDYQIISTNLKDKVKTAFIYKDERFSDHAPLVMDYDILVKNN